MMIFNFLFPKLPLTAVKVAPHLTRLAATHVRGTCCELQIITKARASLRRLLAFISSETRHV